MAAQAEVRDLIGRIEKQGYEVRPSGREHFKLYRNGSSVVDEHGPVTIPGTPSTFRWRENTVGRLVNAGVLPSDPYKSTRKKKERNVSAATKHRLASPEMQALKIAAVKERSRKFREATAVLRVRLDPIITKAGGWGGGGRSPTGVTVTEFGGVVYHWAKSRGRVELPATTVHGPNGPTEINETNVAAAAGHLKRPDQTLGERWLPLFTAFVDELERGTGNPPNPEKAKARYFELLRESKGISTGPTSPASLTPLSVGEDEGQEVTPAEATDAGGGLTEAQGADIEAAKDEAAEIEAEQTESERFSRSSGVRVVEDEPTPIAPIRERLALEAGTVEAPLLALEAFWHMARAARNDEKDEMIILAGRLAELELNRGAVR